jgi:arsenate reductase
LLEECGIDINYREYRDDPLSEEELHALLSQLPKEDLEARSWLRTKDRAYKELALNGDETVAQLIPLMAQHPTLLQRPIGILNGRAVIGRPAEKLLNLVE